MGYLEKYLLKNVVRRLDGTKSTNRAKDFYYRCE